MHFQNRLDYPFNHFYRLTLLTQSLILSTHSLYTAPRSQSLNQPKSSEASVIP